MVSYIVSRAIVMVLGTLYPAYRSYKAIKSKDTKEYVKWMMYWIVFAIFTTAEIFFDAIVGFWMPFYYELKILFVLWILSPTTRGSSILYKKFVHPFFTQHEKEIDKYIEQAKTNGYGKLVQYGKKGLDLAADTMVKTAISGQDVLVQQLRRYRSESSLESFPGLNEDLGDETHEKGEGTTRNYRQRHNARRKKTVHPPFDETSEIHGNNDIDGFAETTNLLDQSRLHAASMDNVYLGGGMYDNIPHRHYDETSRISRSTSDYYEGSSTLPRNFSTRGGYNSEHSRQPFETSSHDASFDDYTSGYRYESSTLPRSRDSSRRYNTRADDTKMKIAIP